MTRKEHIYQLKQYLRGLSICMCPSSSIYWKEHWEEVIKALEQEPKAGHWIMPDDGLYRPICNNCGAHPWKGYIPTVEEATEVFKYCPNCGAKMAESARVKDDKRGED